MRNIQISLILLLRFLVFILVSYGLLYFSYKYFSPNYGQSDFFHYYKMVLHPLDFTVTESPFIYRQFSTVITSLIVKSGIYYNTEISYVQEGIKQNVFFAFIFSNYIALLFTALIVSRIVDLKIGKITFLAPILGGLLCYLSFGTSTFVLTGLVEGWSWFLIALAFYAFTRENIYLFLIVLLIAIFQKEVVSIIFGVMSAVYLILSYLRDKKINRTYMYFFLISILSFFTYMLVRKFLIPVSGYENQLEYSQLVHSFMAYRLSDVTKIFATIFPQNLFYLYFLVLFISYFTFREYKNKYRLFHIDYMVSIIFIFIILYSIGMATSLGTNIGRILLVTSPLSAVYIAYFMYLLEYQKNILNE